MASELWWVSIGGNEGEPARLVREGRTRTIFTIGCPDGIDVASASVILIQKIEKAEIPLTDEQLVKAEKAWQRKVQRDSKKGLFHGYRRFTP